MKITKTLLAFTASLALFSCQEEVKIPTVKTDLTKTALIPKPVSITASNSSFLLTNTVNIITEDNAELKEVATFLQQQIKPSTGFSFDIKDDATTTSKRNINLAIVKNDTLKTEGYKLDVSEDNITINANTAEGVFRGVQSFLQLLPPTIHNNQLQKDSIFVPTGAITDYPNFEYRGTMIDVARHFFTVAEIKNYIDVIAYYKINKLHLHLSDDQGWRIEIKSWPKLTTHGGSTQVNGGKGGFYTQEEYKDIVAYAAKRFITVIPEVDMPGHTNAALASYPELNCDGKAPELYTGTKVGFSSLCVRDENTYKFVDDVIRELSEITPGKYIHVGGDETHATPHDDYVYFMNKMQDIVTKHGKTMIGWGETAGTEISGTSVVQQWHAKKNATIAAEKNLKMILSPATHTYLDMKYDTINKIGYTWAGIINVEHGYDWDTKTLFPDVPNELILGIEAPLWAETLSNEADLQFLAFPRLLGYAELGWTKAEQRTLEDYKTRLAIHGKHLDNMGINYYKSPRISWGE